MPKQCHKCTFLVQIKDWLSPRPSLPAPGVAHSSVTKAAALTAETFSTATVRHLNCWAIWTSGGQNRRTLCLELIKMRFTSSLSVVASVHLQWLEILDLLPGAGITLVQPKTRDRHPEKYSCKSSFSYSRKCQKSNIRHSFTHLRILKSIFAHQLSLWNCNSSPTLQRMHSRDKEKGCMTCPSQWEARIRKGKIPTHQHLILLVAQHYLENHNLFSSYKDPMEEIPTQRLTEIRIRGHFHAIMWQFPLCSRACSWL